jgi:hypothetical protein
MAIKKQAPPSLTAQERKTLTQFGAISRDRLLEGMPSCQEMRSATEEAKGKHEEWERASISVDPDRLQRMAEAIPRRYGVKVTVSDEYPALLQRAIAIFRKYEANQRAAIESVRADKRNLYLNPAVRWWIEHMQRWGQIPDDPWESRDFFRRLAQAVAVTVGEGIGREKRMKRGFDWRPAEWVEYNVRMLRRQGKGWGTISEELKLQKGESELRRWAKRRGIK